MSKLLERHLPRLFAFFEELMKQADKAELRRGNRNDIIIKETENTTKRFSLDTVKLMRRDLERSKKELVDAINVQTDLTKKYVDLQIQHQDFKLKIEEAEKRSVSYEQAMTELQNKMVDLQLKLAAQNK